MLKKKLNQTMEVEGEEEDVAPTPVASTMTVYISSLSLIIQLESMIQQAQLHSQKYNQEMKLQKEEFVF